MRVPGFLLFGLLTAGLFIDFGIAQVPWERQVGASYGPPSLQAGSLLFGTDLFGRSVLFKILAGLGTAVKIGFSAALVSVLLGLSLGVLSGGLPGRWDKLIWALSILAGAIPGLVLAMGLSFLFPDSILSLVLALSLTSWVPVYRLARAEVMRTRGLGYALAAELLGAQRAYVFWRHFAPQCAWLGYTQFGLLVGLAIRSEAVLSFLGLGVWRLPSWGVMIEDGRLGLARGVWWELAAPLIAMASVAVITQLAVSGTQEEVENGA